MAMASRFKSLFPWSSTIPDNLPRGRSYDAPISSADYLAQPQRKPQPPPQPQLQQKQKHPSSRDSPTERPKTAPQKAPTWDAGENNGRTRSGFSMKSPPAFLVASRKNSVTSTTTTTTRSRRNSIWSIRTTSEAPPPLPAFPSPSQLPPLPMSPAVYSFPPSPLVSSPSSPQLPSDPSRPAPKPYIDLLDAHSTIKASKARSRPLVVRDYGEDIADRNIATFGEGAGDKAKTARPRPKHIDILAQGDDGINIVSRDAAQQYDAPPSSPRTTSIRSFTAPRAGIAYPPRSDSLRSEHTTSSVSGSGDERGIPSIVVQDRRGHTMSPLSSPVTSVFEDSHAQAPRPRTAGASPSPTRAAPPPPIPDRERRRTPSVATVRSTSQSKPVPPLPSSGTPSRQTSTSSSPPDIASLSDSPRRKARSRLEAGNGPTPTSVASRDDALPHHPAGYGRVGAHRATYSSSNISLSTANGTVTPRTASPHSISTHTPSPSTASSTTAASRKRASSRNGSVSYSAFPSYTTRENRLSDASASARRRSGSRRREYLGSRGTVDLAPMVGRENSVDTQVTTRVAPAVEHEDVIVTKQTIQHEAVTIETHTHEVHHRIQPVIEKEVLPTKHYIPSEDGKSLVEIPESQIPKQAPAGMQIHEIHEQHIAPAQPTAAGVAAASPSEETAAPPVVGLARGEPKPRSRRNSTKSMKSAKAPKQAKPSTRSRAKSLLQPVLASKKEYATEAGHPRTEYVWHHPPVMQAEDNETRPIYVGAGLGDLATNAYSSDEDEDLAGARFGAAAGEGGLLFNESEYARSGSLPGLGRQPGYADLYEPRDTASLTTEMRNMRM